MEMFTIREIQPKDNQQIASVIRSVLVEHHVPKVGTAYADVSLDQMFETYQTEKAQYFVVEYQNQLVGGAGIAPLENGPEGICELQKMYFLPIARRKGQGSVMMQTCLDFAKKAGYQQVYLETMPNMLDAQKMYQKFGFTYIDAPMGCTGHTSCPVWMLLKF
ncbi:MAG: GNAT family N-acetyltransferase [Flavobacterium sp.]